VLAAVEIGGGSVLASGFCDVGASLLDLLRPLFGEQLQELAGGVVTGEIPLTTAALNRLIAGKLATANAPIASAEIETHPEETFTAHLRPKGPIPALTVDVRIDRQPELPDHPYLGMQWTLRGIGPLAMLAAPVISYFKALPPGISIDRDRIWVDLHTLLRSQGAGEVIPFLTGIRVLTRERRFVVQFELRR
jgi:hypothetical protein